MRDESDEVSWRDLQPHAVRDAVFLLSGDLTVQEAVLAVARDDRDAVERWLQAGMLARPTDAQLARWTNEQDKRFECQIAQPFVLAREV